MRAYVSSTPATEFRLTSHIGPLRARDAVRHRQDGLAALSYCLVSAGALVLIQVPPGLTTRSTSLNDASSSIAHERYPRSRKLSLSSSV